MMSTFGGVADADAADADAADADAADANDADANDASAGSAAPSSRARAQAVGMFERVPRRRHRELFSGSSRRR
jgi:hypothetical protein